MPSWVGEARSWRSVEHVGIGEQQTIPNSVSEASAAVVVMQDGRFAKPVFTHTLRSIYQWPNCSICRPTFALHSITRPPDATR